MAKITIFGLEGTGTRSAGKTLAEFLGYNFLSSEQLFKRKANELGIEFCKFEEFCRRNPKYDLELDRSIAEFGRKKDNFVVESRLAYHFIPDSIKVKFICSYYTRVRRVANRHGIPFSSASEKTNARESAAIKRYRQFYSINRLAPDNKFDLIIETSHKSVPEIVAIIISKFKLPIIKG